VYVETEASNFSHSWLTVGGWVHPPWLIPYTFKHAYIYIFTGRMEKRGEEGVRKLIRVDFEYAIIEVA
jgi:hypothetical protein